MVVRVLLPWSGRGLSHHHHSGGEVETQRSHCGYLEWRDGRGGERRECVSEGEGRGRECVSDGEGRGRECVSDGEGRGMKCVSAEEGVR